MGRRHAHLGGGPALRPDPRLGARLEFRYPLIRAAIYDGALFLERQAAHRALAAALHELYNPAQLHVIRRVGALLADS